ncbi:hypothetical protein IIA94_00205 [Patescibacteria group bacterium]|nr:hypothetical protein [Patescibacteria group bacterium]
MNEKNRNAQDIIEKIRALLDELSSSAFTDAKNRTLHTLTDQSPQKISYSGATGGVKMLLAEGFFREPKALPEVVSHLHQEGFNYSRQVISVALLRFVRSRRLLRRPTENQKGREKWVYAERK